MPNFLHYTYTIFLLALGMAFIGVLLFPLSRSFLAAFKGAAEQVRLKKGDESLKRVDQLLEEGDLKAALIILRQSLILETVSTREGIKAAREHNQQILTRFIEIGEEHSVHLQNLAEVEQLFVQHHELQILLMKANESFSRLQAKREQEKKTLPDWTKSDFQRRIREVQQELKVNRTRLEQVIKEIVAALETRQTSDVTYH